MPHQPPEELPTLLQPNGTHPLSLPPPLLPLSPAQKILLAPYLTLQILFSPFLDVIGACCDRLIDVSLAGKGYGAGSCGYCRSEEGSLSYGMSSNQLSPRVYQLLLNRGYRRSGTYIYHPDMSRTCCPQYTIRLAVAGAGGFQPMREKKLRKVMRRWERFVREGLAGEGEKGDGVGNGNGKAKGKGKGKSMTEVDWVDELYSIDAGRNDLPKAHNFQVELVPAKATKESFALYNKYQIAVHGDAEGKNTMEGFWGFLCENPLGEQLIPYPKGKVVPKHLPKTYGCYHQQYRIDGTLIAFSVIDILPGCVSSVYFVWDPGYAWASLGKLSVLREAALARELVDAGMVEMGWLYMGYYIHSCPKMRYKGDYSPSYLLDPGTNEFHSLKDVIPLLDANPSGYTPFTLAPTFTSFPNPAFSDPPSPPPPKTKRQPRKSSDFPSPPPPSFLSPSSISSEYVRALLVVLDGRVARFDKIPFRNQRRVEGLVKELVAALGMEVLAAEGQMREGVFLTF